MLRRTYPVAARYWGSLPKQFDRGECGVILVDDAPPPSNGYAATHAVVHEIRAELRELTRTAERMAHMLEPVSN